MQYDVNNVSEYLDALEADWRKEMLLKIRAYILDSGKDIREGIEYKMLVFEDSVGSIFHLNAQKNFVGLYAGDLSEIDFGSNYLKGMDCGKSCIRIRKSYVFENSDLMKFISKAVDMHKFGQEHSC